LAEELAPKVNLFKKVWDQDPQAEFYGGTSRDYLYWLKGQFKEAGSAAKVSAIEKKLRALPVIDIRDFIIGESDIDVISGSKVVLNPKDFGVKSIDVRGNEIFNTSTTVGKSELDQGYIPAEKIRLTQKGFTSSKSFGDGVHEIYEGKLTVHFTDSKVFEKSHYAQQKLNHPILLALRYLRLQAMDYFQSYGAGFPDREKLFAPMDANSARSVRKVIKSASDGEELIPYLKQSSFSKWLNGSIRKAFRSYTNPTAAMELMKEFDVPTLISRYSEIEPINQYLFAQTRDPSAEEKALRDYRVHPESFYLSPKKEFQDGFLYHGTRTDDAFRSILFQGIIHSSEGVGGAGLYGVNSENKSFAESWGGSPKNLVRFEVRPDAKVVDITQGEGERVWKEFMRRHGGSYEDFCQKFGIDILAYPYKTRAYVVKNSTALSRPEGVNRQLLSFSKAIEKVKEAKTIDELEQLLDLSHESFSSSEQRQISDVIAKKIHQMVKVSDPSIYYKLMGMGVHLQADFHHLVESGKIDPNQATDAQIDSAARGILKEFDQQGHEVEIKYFRERVGERIFARGLDLWVDQFKPEQSLFSQPMRTLQALQKEALTPAQARKLIEKFPAFPWRDRGYWSLLKKAELAKLSDPVRAVSKIDELEEVLRKAKDLPSEERAFVLSELESHKKFELLKSESPDRVRHLIETSKDLGIEEKIRLAVEGPKEHELTAFEKEALKELDSPKPRIEAFQRALPHLKDSESFRDGALKWVKNWVSSPEKSKGQEQQLAELLTREILDKKQIAEVSKRVNAVYQSPGDARSHAESLLKWARLTLPDKGGPDGYAISKFFTNHFSEVRDLLTAWFKEDSFWEPHLSGLRTQLISNLGGEGADEEFKVLVQEFFKRPGLEADKREIFVRSLYYFSYLEEKYSEAIEKSGIRSSNVMDFLKLQRNKDSVIASKGRLLNQILKKAQLNKNGASGDYSPEELAEILREIAETPFSKEDVDKIDRFKKSVAEAAACISKELSERLQKL
jgi:hypothetical protein